MIPSAFMIPSAIVHRMAVFSLLFSQPMICWYIKLSFLHAPHKKVLFCKPQCLFFNYRVMTSLHWLNLFLPQYKFCSPLHSMYCALRENNICQQFYPISMFVMYNVLFVAFLVLTLLSSEIKFFCFSDLRRRFPGFLGGC